MQSAAKFVRYGRTPDFDIFIQFVKEEIAPYMEMELEIEDYLEEVYNEFREHQYTAEQIHRGAGKAQSLDSCVLTPKGWVKFRDLKEGDEVICGNGKITKIKWLHPIEKRKIYEITTFDGRKAQCHDEHLWVVTRPTRTRKKKRVLKLNQIMNNYYDERIDKRNNRQYREYTYYIPNPKPIQFKEKELLIDPYTLGYWLGDGSSYDGRITTDDPEIFNYIPYKNITKLKDKFMYYIKGINPKLRELNLIPKNKHIPEDYLFSSIEQRTALLQGLVDSDGHIPKRGGWMEFANKNERLIDDFVKLVRSLGGTARKKKRITKCKGKDFDSFRVSFQVPKSIVPSKLKRKRKYFKGNDNLQNAIVDIKYIKDDLTRCITVEDADATYITDDYLMTHNTEIGIWITIFYAVCQPINPFSNKPIKEQLIITQAGEAIDTVGSRIKHYFYENPNLRQFIPDGVSTKNRKNDYWNSKEIYLKNGHIIHFRPINSRSIRGNHVDRIWADDLVGDNSQVVDKDIFEKWFYGAHGCTTAKNALVDVTGTPRRFTDIMYKMKENKSYFFKARPILDQNGEILSSKRWDQQKIDQVKATIGSVIFQCEYMLNPLDDSTGLIKSSWIKQCFDKSRNFQQTRPNWAVSVYLGVDFAFSDRLVADRSAFVILAKINNYDPLTNQNSSKFVVLDLITKKGLSGLEQFEFMKQLHSVYNFEMIGIEENSIKAISKHISSFNLPIKRFWTGSSDERTEKGIIKDYETIGKRNLILRIANQLEQKNLIIPYGESAKDKSDELYDELITFAQEDGKVIEIGKHSDLGMALGFAIEVILRCEMGFFITK